MRLSGRLAEDRAELFEELAKYIEEPVVVEGRKDEEALNELGFHHIIKINRGQGLYEFSVDMKLVNGDRTVLVLTDFDPEGERIAKELETYMHSVGCKTDDIGRERLRVLFRRNKLFTIQGLRNIER